MRRVDPRVYTKKYYLTDCTGFREYKSSFGKILDSRFSQISIRIPSVVGLRVLDIGCGRGEMAFWAVMHGARKAIGIDYSSDAINLANKAKPYFNTDIQSKVQFKVMDAKELNFPTGSIEAVFLIEVLEHLYPEEQKKVFNEVYRVLDNKGFVFIHTAPNRWFNDFAYKLWCYPLGNFLIRINNFITGNDYQDLENPKNIRTDSHKLMHINEPSYLSLRKMFLDSGYKGSILSTNVTVNKPKISWKDRLFNFFVYLYPFSKYFPINMFWGNDFVAVLRKK